MGYTHYWEFKKSPLVIKDTEKKFKKAVKLLKECLKEVPTKPILAFELADGNGEGEPVFDDRFVRFNGVGENAYETFHISLDSDGWKFEFCKTGRKPYDVAVCLALLCFKKSYGKDFSFSSDGDMEDEGWAMAYDIFDKVAHLNKEKPKEDRLTIKDYIKWLKKKFPQDSYIVSTNRLAWNNCLVNFLTEENLDNMFFLHENPQDKDGNKIDKPCVVLKDYATRTY